MCGRFVEPYTWDDIQDQLITGGRCDLYELPDGPRASASCLAFNVSAGAP
jgi:hypothetical protein